MPAPLIIITGPSTAGKSTIADCLIKRKALKLKRFITCTTRPKRPSEKNHRDYHFLTKTEFEREIKNKSLFEWSKVYGQYYGSRKKDLLKELQGKRPILIIVDSQGVKKLKRLVPACCTVFIDVPKKTFLQRIQKRTGSGADLKLRADKFDAEQKAKKIADIVIENHEGKLNQTVEHTACLIDFGILLHKKRKNRQIS